MGAHIRRGFEGKGNGKNRDVGVSGSQTGNTPPPGEDDEDMGPDGAGGNRTPRPRNGQGNPLPQWGEVARASGSGAVDGEGFQEGAKQAPQQGQMEQWAAEANPI